MGSDQDLVKAPVRQGGDAEPWRDATFWRDIVSPIGSATAPAHRARAHSAARWALLRVWSGGWLSAGVALARFRRWFGSVSDVRRAYGPGIRQASLMLGWSARRLTTAF